MSKRIFNNPRIADYFVARRRPANFLWMKSTAISFCAPQKKTLRKKIKRRWLF